MKNLRVFQALYMDDLGTNEKQVEKPLETKTNLKHFISVIYVIAKVLVLAPESLSLNGHTNLFGNNKPKTQNAMVWPSKANLVKTTPTLPRLSSRKIAPSESPKSAILFPRLTNLTRNNRLVTPKHAHMSPNRKELAPLRILA